MRIFDHFNHLVLSQSQIMALTKLELFIEGPSQVFMLKGYAGSGKTTIIKGIAEFLERRNISLGLMAPTGRAAKVLREKTGQDANTVHKSIYSFDAMIEVSNRSSFFYSYKIRNNADVFGKVFIVDEASLLSDTNSQAEFFRFGTGCLLSDLISYSRVGEPNVRTKIIFVGDPCQLPPVNESSSKAFDFNYLKEKFHILSEEVEMKEVQRQGGESGVFQAASKIRKSITANFFNDFDLRSNHIDILNPSFVDFFDEWQKTSGTKIIIASKNKTCLGLNLQIRERLFGSADLPVQKSDVIIFGGNNYHKGVFNGEFAIVNSINEVVVKRLVALRGKEPVLLVWRDVEFVILDSDGGNNIVKGKILENFLYGDNVLKPEESQALYVDFIQRNNELKSGSEEFKDAILNDEYFNCLLVKFGYSVTCHKAQGGEWDSVFTVWDNDNINGFDCFIHKQRKNGKTNQDFFRWAYTAITRASCKLYALNPPFFNSYASIAVVDLQVQNAIEAVIGKSTQFEQLQISSLLINELENLGLSGQPIQVQDHFIKVRHILIQHSIDVVLWEKIGYEIRYTFSKGTARAMFRTYVNGKFEVNKIIALMPNQSGNLEFNQLIIHLLTENELANFSVKRDTIDTVLEKIEFDLGFEEQYPFTKRLFDDLHFCLKNKGVSIEKLDHLQFKERYTFQRNAEQAVFDFEYNQNGFFGRVLSIQKMSNSLSLIADIQHVVLDLSELEYAC